jgi:protein-S-isoprenylcysteine O-methyltransferase Ste14
VDNRFVIAIIADYWASMAAFLLFGVLHSLGAQEVCKNWLGARVGRFFVDHFWRLTYCFASYASLYYVISNLHWGLHPAGDQWLFAYPEWLWRLLVTVHIASVAFIYVAFVQSDYLEFWGFRQAWRGLAALRGKAPRSADLALFGTHRLVVHGLYAWVRHPMLVGGLLFLLTSGPSMNNLAFVGMYCIYMLIGAYYEERRLLRIFGDQYRDYRRQVGAFYPNLRQWSALCSGT